MASDPDFRAGVSAGRVDRQTLPREFLPVLQQAASGIGAAARGA